MRAAAREFLDLFRVKRFAAVPVDPRGSSGSRRAGSTSRAWSPTRCRSWWPRSRRRRWTAPRPAPCGPGSPPQLPAALPARTELAEAKLSPAASFRVQVDTGKLEALALAAGADEIEIPAFWNGATIDVEVPPVLGVRYARKVDAAGAALPREDSFVLLQSAIPQVELPEGFDLATLGRLGLRLAGMSATEALSFSRAIDWRSTLLVPVPVQGGTFREVEVSGHKGLLVTFQPPAPADASAPRPRAQGLVLWSTDDKVMALQGPGSAEGIDLLEMAQSDPVGRGRARPRGAGAPQGLRSEDRGPGPHPVRAEG